MHHVESWPKKMVLRTCEWGGTRGSQERNADQMRSGAPVVYTQENGASWSVKVTPRQNGGMRDEGQIGKSGRPRTVYLFMLHSGTSNIYLSCFRPFRLYLLFHLQIAFSPFSLVQSTSYSRFFLIAVISKDKERLAVAMVVWKSSTTALRTWYIFLFFLSSETDVASGICVFEVFRSEVTRFFQRSHSPPPWNSATTRPQIWGSAYQCYFLRRISPQLCRSALTSTITMFLARYSVSSTSPSLLSVLGLEVALTTGTRRTSSAVKTGGESTYRTRVVRVV